ncbi:MAG: hypothetical protein A4E30_00306 [Methanomassiliicoccales archaeon PtaB.Bin215]|nr:MAG: hypothetical protein A4E30_00306 [Methanomassiliicoccales archaeon PtaB.Bin215]
MRCPSCGHYQHGNKGGYICPKCGTRMIGYTTSVYKPCRKCAQEPGEGVRRRYA